MLFPSVSISSSGVLEIIWLTQTNVIAYSCDDIGDLVITKSPFTADFVNQWLVVESLEKTVRLTDT